MTSTMVLASADSLRLEVCVDSLDSALQAVEGGADRLEVCSSLIQGGGMTPSYGLVKAIQQNCSIPLMIMIRPRVGDFTYSEPELAVMMQDIEAFKSLGVQGFVLGVLTEEYEVDVARTQRLVDAAQPREVTFHRAFDMTTDFVNSYKSVTLITGVNRILTSGLTVKLTDGGLQTLARCISAISNRSDRESCSKLFALPAILPGSGIGPSSIDAIIDVLWPLGVTEYHLSAGRVAEAKQSSESGEAFFNCLQTMGMGPSGVWTTRADVLRNVKQVAVRAIERLRESRLRQ